MIETMNPTPGELADLIGAPLVDIPSRREMRRAYLDALTVYCIAVRRRQPIEQLRTFAADVSAIGRECDRYRYDLDEEQMIMDADARAYDLLAVAS